MTAFWHWYVVIITLAVTAALVWLFYGTSRMRVEETPDSEGTTGHVWDEDLREYNNPMPRWWLWMFYISAIFSVLYLVLYPGLGRYEGVLGWSQEKQHDEQVARAAQDFESAYGELAALPVDELAQDSRALEAGRNIFAHNCSTCHGSDARGAEGYPNLTNNQWIWGGEPERVLETIQHGRQALMTPFGDMLSDQEITRTAAYVQQLAGRRADATMAAAGKKVFDMHCVACHGPDGTGNIHLGAPDLTAGVYTYGGDLNTIRTTIRSGRNGQMPAQLELLGEARTRLVAAYVLSLNQDDHAEK
ncbi:MAG TPA: cytochrome-c oxidase, cbb3-type subunit III [Wenzhouxiangella sp.]|nr:cytochrome-c oxidase, cbb3-type subunit III [Wenzhouxiangella sp.]